MSSIRAVTFDFGSTLYAPRDQGQLEAAGDGCATVLRDALADASYAFSPGAVRAAFQLPAAPEGPVVTLGDAVDAMCRQLDINIRDSLRRRLLRSLDEVAGQIQWRRPPGAMAVLRHLRQRDYRLGLVANAYFPSSRVLRQVLAVDGALMYFQAFAFSDEVGACKPDATLFRHILYHLDLDTDPGAVVHVGDHPETDIAGARAVGMRTVRFAGICDRSGAPEADVVIHDFRQLPDLIRNWPAS